MARHRSFSFEFKRQLVLDFLEGRAELRGLHRDALAAGGVAGRD